MNITPTNAAAAQTTQAKPEKSSTLDYDSFLQLLIAQMKNQDPTEPMDSAQYVAQLASFSGVEQAVKTNAKLDELLTSQTLSQADGLIGRSITSEDGAVTGKVASIRVLSGSAAAILEDGRQVTLGAGVTIGAR